MTYLGTKLILQQTGVRKRILFRGMYQYLNKHIYQYFNGNVAFTMFNVGNSNKDLI